MTSDNSVTLERSQFLRCLKSNPFFLLRHLPSIAGIFLRTYQSRRNRPLTLSYLPKTLNTSLNLDAAYVWQAIPQGNLTENYDELKNLSLKPTTLNNVLNDGEDYFRQHRFAELILLLGSPNLPTAVAAWLDNPPPKTDKAWETYSTCERVANLLTWIRFLPLELRKSLPSTILTFLTESLERIFSHLEYYGKRSNNHLLNNARALILLGVTLDHPDAIFSGANIAENCMAQLIQPQGMLRERSTHYQWVIFNWLLDMKAFLTPAIVKKNPTLKEFLTHLQDTIARMQQACAFLIMTTDGLSFPLIGDVSPDMPPEVSEGRVKVCHPHYYPLPSTPSTRTTPYQVCDDFIRFQQGQHALLLNRPTRGKLPITYPTHGHNDMTSFVWFYGDQAILIDSGRSRYIKDAISIQQKSAYGHNVLLVNRFPPCCESLIVQGQWWPTPYANMTINAHYDNDEKSLRLRHDGFRRATPVKWHERTFNFDKNRLIVRDKLIANNASTSAPIHTTTLWHLHPSFKKISKNTFRNDQYQLSIHAPHSQIRIDTEHTHAWMYGECEQHCLVKVTRQAACPWEGEVTFEVTTLCAQ